VSPKFPYRDARQTGAEELASGCRRGRGRVCLSVNGTFKRAPVYGSSAEEANAKLTEIKARSNRGLPAEATGWTVKA
jgi:hypothetical protein